MTKPARQLRAARKRIYRSARARVTARWPPICSSLRCRRLAVYLPLLKCPTTPILPLEFSRLAPDRIALGTIQTVTWKTPLCQVCRDRLSLNHMLPDDAYANLATAFRRINRILGSREKIQLEWAELRKGQPK